MNVRGPGTSRLAGWNVLVTRPAGQAESLCTLIERAGGHPVRFPLIAIEPSGTADSTLRLLQRLEDWDWLIFVSANAVHYGCGLGDWWKRLPDRLRIAAIGRGTRAALRELGLRVDLSPKAQFNSESLLDGPEFHAVEGQRFLLVRGCGGRELIAETLRRRGATVEYAEVYRRVTPRIVPDDLIPAWRRGEIHALVLSSGEALENLVKLLGTNHLDLLADTPVAVISERLATRAKDIGCRRIDIAPEASDAGLCSAILHLANSTRG